MIALWRVLCLIEVMILMLFSGCRISDRSDSLIERKQMPQLMLTEKDQGKSITVKAGDTITVTLNENPTTGFRWEVEKYDADIIALRNSSFVPPATSSPGAGGEHVFMFEGKKPGTAQLALELKRNWQASDAVTKRYAVSVSVAE